MEVALSVTSSPCGHSGRRDGRPLPSPVQYLHCTSHLSPLESPQPGLLNCNLIPSLDDSLGMRLPPWFDNGSACNSVITTLYYCSLILRLPHSGSHTQAPTLRLPHSGTQTLKSCRHGEPGIFPHVSSVKSREGVERP